MQGNVGTDYSITLEGPDGIFQIKETDVLNGNLAPNSKVEFTLLFSPDNEGSFFAVMRIKSWNDEYEVRLIGEGTFLSIFGIFLRLGSLLDIKAELIPSHVDLGICQFGDELDSEVYSLF